MDEVSAKINQEADEVLNKFLNDQARSPSKQDIIEHNKEESFILIHEAFKANRAIAMIDYASFNYEDLVTYTPKALRLSVFLSLGLGFGGALLAHNLLIFLAIIPVSLTLLFFCFQSFKTKIKVAIENDFCSFNHWYEKKRFIFKFEEKIYKFPENWGNIIVKKRFS